MASAAAGNARAATAQAARASCGRTAGHRRRRTWRLCTCIGGSAVGTRVRGLSAMILRLAFVGNLPTKSYECRTATSTEKAPLLSVRPHFVGLFPTSP